MMILLKKLVSLNVRLCDYLGRKFPHFVKGESYQEQLLSFVNERISDRDFCSVLEVGGIDRPLLKRSSKFTYDGLDIEHKPQCENIYDNFHVQSIETPIKKKYDLIISMTLLEHVKDNDASFEQIFNALKTGGQSIHYFPSKYHPYSILLRLVGTKLQKFLIKHLRPWAVDVTGYPAYFDNCCPKQIKILCTKKGFSNIHIIPFYRANDYFRFCFPCYLIVTFWENICKKFKLERFCSGMVIVLGKS